MLLKLKARIIEKYARTGRFAVACGKGEQWLSRIICERQKATAEEKEMFRTKLQLEDENFEKYFQGSQDI